MIRSWCKLGNTVGLFRGGLTLDTVGTFNYSLIVATTEGFVYQVEAGDQNCGRIKFLTRIKKVHLEGIIVVPNDTSVWGPLAGNILVGAEVERKAYSISPKRDVTAYETPGCAIEDIDLITPGENFFGVNYAQNRVRIFFSLTLTKNCLRFWE